MASLTGIKIIDFTHVQAGPTCTQQLAWLGADVIKVEPPGKGDITRSQLRDRPEVDSLYFTMLNHNKRSLTLDVKTIKGKEIFSELIKNSDVLVENFADGVLERLGFGWDIIHAINPRLVLASIKGFPPGPHQDVKLFENIAQCVGGSASTTGHMHEPPMTTSAQIGDIGTGMQLALGIVSALFQRHTTGQGQHVIASMQDTVMNFLRIKLRDQLRIDAGVALKEYAAAASDQSIDTVPRTGNAHRSFQPGKVVKCKGWQTDPNSYIYVQIINSIWPTICKIIGKEHWILDPSFAEGEPRYSRAQEIFDAIESWSVQHDKFEAWQELKQNKIPSGPVMSWRDISNAQWLKDSQSIVTVSHPVRGDHITVGNPVRMSEGTVDISRAPLLGEHCSEILLELGYQPREIELLKMDGVI